MPKNNVTVGGNVSGGVVTAGDRNRIGRAEPTEHKVSVDMRDSHGNVVLAGGQETRLEGEIRNQPAVSISHSVDLVEVRERITDLRRTLQGSNVPMELRQEVEAELDTGLAQLRKKEPDTGLVKVALQNAAKTLGTLAGSGAMHQLIQGVTAIVSML